MPSPESPAKRITADCKIFVGRCISSLPSRAGFACLLGASAEVAGRIGRHRHGPRHLQAVRRVLVGPCMNAKLHARLERGDPIDHRGDGKAGGGLVLAVQAFGASLAARGDLDVQDWPLFSSARKGANVRAFLRVARGKVEATCQVTSPDIALLMNEAAAEQIDFA